MLPCFINLDMFIELVKELISIGISGIIPENSNLSKFLLYSDGLLRENITSSLTNDDLVNVFKGWVIVETDLPFYCGSTPHKNMSLTLHFSLPSGNGIS